MNETIQQAPDLFDKALRAIADGFNIAVENLVPILLKQVYIDGIYEVIVLVLSIIGIVAGILMLKKVDRDYIKVKEINKVRNSGEDTVEVRGITHAVFVVGFVLLIFSGMAFVFRLIGLKDTLTAFMNPEYRMIDMVIEMVGNMSN